MDEKHSPLHPLGKVQTDSGFSMKLFAVIIIVVLLGVGSGLILSKSSGTNSQKISFSQGQKVPKGTVMGSTDTVTFKDSTEGVEKTGGIAGEGQYHLIRPGGDSQNVYLTSSLVDLSLFINQKIKVWGQTQKAQHAGWLIDVGRVEVE